MFFNIYTKKTSLFNIFIIGYLCWNNGAYISFVTPLCIVLYTHNHKYLEFLLLLITSNSNLCRHQLDLLMLRILYYICWSWWQCASSFIIAISVTVITRWRESILFLGDKIILLTRTQWQYTIKRNILPSPAKRCIYSHSLTLLSAIAVRAYCQFSLLS